MEIIQLTAPTKANARAFMNSVLQYPETGVEVRFQARGLAVRFRQLCYGLRSEERKRNMKIYETDAPMYGKSPWDDMALTLGKTEDGTYAIKAFIGGDDTLQLFDPNTGEKL